LVCENQFGSGEYPKLRLLVDGQWLDADGRDTLAVHNPATGEVLARLPVATDSDIERVINAAERAFPIWKSWTAHARGKLMQEIASEIRARCDALARILTLEQGKPLHEAVAEINATADTFEWMAEEGKRAYGRVVPSRAAGLEQFVLLEPVGPVAALSPWNFPAILTGRKIATALAAGCTVVAKPAEETPGILVALALLCQDAGLPPGVLNLLFGIPAQISQRLISAPAIRKISFTGSVPVGRELSALAGAAMKKITLELGGHSAVIVCDDADIERATAITVAAKYRNAGQVCHCPTRFFIQRGAFNAFVAAFSGHASSIRVGNGLDPETQMGPLGNRRRVAALQALCDDARAGGGEIVCGGTARVPSGTEAGGFWWEPTVIARPHATARALHEEPFGPLALMVPFDTLDEAILAANATDYGLAAYGFTESLHTEHRLRTELQAGSIAINTCAMAPPELPFSGIKASGIGYEMSMEGLLEHLHAKSILRFTH
jgi:succinate-semialdehyde dehydrogenase/glutarate-semialdehyde dehydrogenase